MVCNYYIIVTFYYVIITQGSIITHYYQFQSPERADVFIFRSRKSNIEAKATRKEILGFMTANLNDTHYRIQHRLGLKQFSLHSFCSMLIVQLIDLRKVRTENHRWIFSSRLLNKELNRNRSSFIQ